MPRRLPKYVQAFHDTHGHPRHYFRKKGAPRVTLPGLPWSEQFMSAYAAALAPKVADAGAEERAAEKPQRPTVERVAPGSMAALISHYKRSKFPELGKVTQDNYTRLFARLEEAAGSLPVAKITEDDIRRMVDERTAEGGIEAGNSTRRIFRLLMGFAKDHKYRKDNPAIDIKKKRKPKGAKRGWDTLSEDNIVKYFERWPLGTRQHLAMTVLLYTGQRRGDVVRLGPHSVVGGKYDLDNLAGRSIDLRQNKTGKELTIPLAPQLAAALKACNLAADAPAFILSAHGKPYSDKSFTGKFSAWGRTAGIKTQCSPHTLRFAAARRLAELGCSLKVIASITGHESLKELERYTKAAEQKRLARKAIDALATPPAMG